MTVRLPALSSVTVNGQSGISGIYDGQSWTLVKNDVILLDIGPKQEKVTVQSATLISPSTGADVVLTLPARPTPPIVHSRGCIMQLNAFYTINVNGVPTQYQNVLGNPGPQTSFNYKDVRYAPVVPFVKQLD